MNLSHIIIVSVCCSVGGTLHETSFGHPLLDRFNPEMASNGTLPRYPRGGDSNSANATSSDGNDFSVAFGASWRPLLDVGREDQAEMTNAPEQSGDPRSPFCANFLVGWATDRSFPLVRSRAAVDANTVKAIRFQPE